MSWINQIFGNGNAQQQQQPQQQQVQQQPQGTQPAQQQQQQQPNPHLQGNPTLPQNSGMPAQPATPTNPTGESPTDKYANLWDTSNQQQQQAPNFKLNPESLQKVTSSMNFTQGIQKEDLQKIAQGGEEAVVALQNILTNFGQNIFSQSAQFSAHMTESGYNAAQKEISTGLPGVVRNHMASASLFEANPKLRDPALQPLVGALQSQFAAKFPNASPAEINNMVTDYMGTTVAGAFQKPVDPATQKQENAQPNFASWL